MFDFFSNTRRTRRKPQHPTPDLPPGQPLAYTKAYVGVPYVYNAGLHHSYVNVATTMVPTTPSVPPPPYQPYGYQYPQPPTASAHQRPCQSQPFPPTTQDKAGHRVRNKQSASTLHLRLPTARAGRQERAWENSGDLLAQTSSSRFNDCPIVGSMIQGAALCDRIGSRIDDVLALIDHDEEEGVVDENLAYGIRDLSTERSKPDSRQNHSILDFRKTYHYANSRLPKHVPPMTLYLPTWHIICAAAQASMEVYKRPRTDEKRDYVQSDWRQGTKAMFIKSRPVDDRNLIVIAIRGSKWNIVDWAVNFRPSPSEPTGFLDDEGNACHAGFLQVARAMVTPIAARLRQMLEQNPSRASSSLLLTGHSAGGAVASLLYMHMMATRVESELNILTGCFKRVHCVTFGTPPLTLLPLQNPSGRRYEKNLFYHFANEGDLVVRADKQYLATLTKIIAAPSPLSNSNSSQQTLRQKISKQALRYGSQPHTAPALKWPMPPATLSNAGRMVLLRQKPGSHQAVEAVQITDEQLRDLIFGDPEMHRMELYARRIDELAIAAVTGRGIG